MNEDNIPVIRSPIECINLVVNFVSNSIAPLLVPLYPLTVPLVLLPRTHHLLFAYFALHCPEVDLIRIKESGTLYPQLLPLAHLHVRLIDIVHQGVAPGRALVEVA